MLSLQSSKVNRRDRQVVVPWGEVSHEPPGRAGCAQPAAFRLGCECINELGNRLKAVPANLSANRSSA